MRTNFKSPTTVAEQRRQAIATYANTGMATEVFRQAGNGDFAAADKIAKATGTGRLDVLAFIRDEAEAKVWNLGKGSESHGAILGANGLPFQADHEGGIKSGGTVAHFTGFRSFVDKGGGSIPLNTLTKKKPAPTERELGAGMDLIASVPLADQHAHEIGSAPTARIGESVRVITSRPLDEQKKFLEGLRKEAGAITKGHTEAFVVKSLDQVGKIASAEVIASPDVETGFRVAAGRARLLLREVATLPPGPRRSMKLESVARSLQSAKEMAKHLDTDGAKQFLEVVGKTYQKASSEPTLGAQALEPFSVGIINNMVSALSRSVEAKTALLSGDNSVFSEFAETGLMQLAGAVLRLRNAAALQKPNDKKWNEVSGQINGALEFFVRYKSVLGTHAGKMDGAGVAEVAQGRASNVKANLGYQEIRADLDTDRFSRRFEKDHKPGMLSMKELASASGAFATEIKKSGMDAFMTYALTKREVVASPDDPDEANIEAPMYAKQAENFVDAFFEGPLGAPSEDAKTLQAGMNGIDHGGRETPERTPMLFIRGHGKRVVNNTLELQHALKSASPELTSLIEKAVANPALLGAWKGTSEAALDPDKWTATAGGQTLSLHDPEAMQAQLGALGPTSPMDWNVRAGAMSIEDMSSVNRAVLDAMRTHAAMTGTEVDIPQLGATMHTGEQIRSCPPDVLLDQVAQSLAMGADRLGHGVILGTPMQLLYEPGPSGKLWPTMMSERQRQKPENAIYSKTPAEVRALDADREKMLDRVIDAGVVIEVNITSNLVINDQTPQEHCINAFSRKMHDGLRFTINTDDETILATNIKAELNTAHIQVRYDLVDTSRLILESFRSRLGGKPLRHKQKLAAEFTSNMVPKLTDGPEEQTQRRVDELSSVMAVPWNKGVSAEDQIALIVNKALA